MKATALARSTIGVIIFITVITIWAEMSSGLKGALAAVTGHHWVTKSVFSVILFAILAFAFNKMPEAERIDRELEYVLGATVIGGLAIFIFYVLHFFG